MEKAFGREAVVQVLGEPSHLEKAEMMLLEIEEGKITPKEKYAFLIDIAYAISDACGRELDSNNAVWQKYATIYNEIPIQIMERTNLPGLFFIGDFQEKEMQVSADELEKIINWMFMLPEETKKHPEKKAFFEYIFELVHISLKRIFEEVKKEIRG